MSYWIFESDILVIIGKAQFLLHNLSRLLSGAEVTQSKLAEANEIKMLLVDFQEDFKQLQYSSVLHR